MVNKHFSFCAKSAVIAFAVMLAGLSNATPANAAVNVVTSITTFSSIAEAIGGKHVSVSSIGKGNQDPHFLDPKPSVIRTLSKADLLVVIGLEMEIGYIGPLLEGSRNSKIQIGSPGYVDSSRGIKVKGKPIGVVDRSMGDIHVGGNPHYWLDPLNGIIIARNIANGLIRIDPANAADYKANLAAFSDKIESSMKKWKTTLAPYKGAKIIDYHESWLYFVERFDLNVIDHIEDRPGVPPTATHLINLIRKMKDNDVKAILMETYYSPDTAQKLAGKTGAKVLIAAQSPGSNPGVSDYFSMFDHLTAEMAIILSGK